MLRSRRFRWRRSGDAVPTGEMPATVAHRCPQCCICGRATVVNLDAAALLAWQRGALVQVAFPNLNAAERELLISGTHPSCWDTLSEDDD